MGENKKIKFVRMVLFLILLLPGFSIHAQPFIVGYYPSWLRGDLPAENIQFTHVTHLIHAFAWPDTDGNIIADGSFLYPQLIEKTHQAGRKILVAFGGWGQSAGFSSMAAKSAVRTQFIQNVANFISTNGYDGVDLDWEFPASATDRSNLTALVVELRQKLDEINPSLLLTMAVNPGSYYGQWFSYADLVQYIDWFAAMTYDFHGSWTSHAGHNSPLYQPPNCSDGSVNDGIQYLHVTRGIPAAKLLLGIPFYGREFNASELYGSSTGGDVTYRYSEIMQLFVTGNWIRYWDSFSKVPYLKNISNTKLITYDDTLSVRYKVEYALQKQLAGVMIWALGHDVIGNIQPLLEKVAQTIQLETSIAPADQPVRQFHIFHNYPNPFYANGTFLAGQRNNSSTTIQFSLQQAGNVRLVIYNIQGELVKTVIDQADLSIGLHQVQVDFSDEFSGIYFAVLEQGHQRQTNKMIFIQ